jgi:hypothetical protein
MFISTIVALACASEKLQAVAIDNLAAERMQGRPKTWENKLLRYCIWISNSVLREKLLIYSVLSFVLGSILVKADGGPTVNIFLNALSACFILEVDSLILSFIQFYTTNDTPEVHTGGDGNESSGGEGTEGSSSECLVVKPRIAATIAATRLRQREHAHLYGSTVFVAVFIVFGSLLLPLQIAEVLKKQSSGSAIVNLQSMIIISIYIPIYAGSLVRQITYCCRVPREVSPLKQGCCSCSSFCCKQASVHFAEWWWFVVFQLTVMTLVNYAVFDYGNMAAAQGNTAGAVVSVWYITFSITSFMTVITQLEKQWNGRCTSLPTTTMAVDVEVEVPAGMAPGQQLWVPVPGSDSEKNVVTIPEGLLAGDVFTAHVEVPRQIDGSALLEIEMQPEERTGVRFADGQPSVDGVRDRPRGSSMAEI